VAGLVVDQTGKPLGKVHVRLVGSSFTSNEGPDAVYGATSDAAGQFSVDNMKPGIYLVMAERAGFVQAATAGAPMGFVTLGLKPGEHLTGYKLVMTARALIAGRVVDEYGDPVEGLEIMREPVPPARFQFEMFGNARAVTDDRGEFRLIGAPGKYFLKAITNNQGGPAEIRTDGTSGAPLVTTYYPSAAGTAGASVVQVAAGQDLTGVEIRMTRAGSSAAARGLTVSGVVAGAPGDEPVSVMLRFGENAAQMYGSQMTAAGADGKFTFSGVQPGDYIAAAFVGSGKTFLQSRGVSFHLDAADETGLQLTLSPGEELTGTLAFTGDAPSGEAETRTVRLEATDGVNFYGQAAPAPAAVGKDGSFRIVNLPAGKFRPVVEPMPEDGYVKEVALDGKAVEDRVLDFSQGAGGSRLKITISRAGGRISGKVLGKDGQPAVGMVMVFLASDAKHMEDGADRVSDGNYSIKAIRPGKYRLFAIDVLELMPLLAADDAEAIMRPFFDATEEIEVKEDARISKDIAVWTRLPEKKAADAPVK
jgi:hypothetical protein